MTNKEYSHKVKEIDIMHKIMPFFIPRRTDNEAVVKLKIDINKINEYINSKNFEGIDYKYTYFHVISAAIAKTLFLRPKLNRYYFGNYLYQRDKIILSFVIKKQFNDEAEEALAYIDFDNENDPTINTIYSKLKATLFTVRNENKANNTDFAMRAFTKIPNFILKFVLSILKITQSLRCYPFLSLDPYYSSVFITNLGSIKLDASYHHLSEWGTNSVFCIIGKKYKEVQVDDGGKESIKDLINISLILDERIADGFYFSKCFKVIEYLLNNPSELDKPLDEKINYEV